MIRAIAVIDASRGIAKDGDIPWNIPEDTRYYRDKTEHSIIVMGKDTYQGFEKPLINRRNIVVSRHLDSIRDGFELIHDVETFLRRQTEDIWIIGGAGLYETTLELCDELYLTHVAGNYDCDRFFPDYDNFELSERSADRQQNGYDFYYAIYKNR